MRPILAAGGDTVTASLSIASLAIALVAVLISLVSLYRSHLAPFAVVTVVGDLRLSVDSIKYGKRSWYIASVDMPIQVVNSGARIGRILKYRLKVSYPSLHIDNAYEIFEPVWVVDRRLFAASADRSEWLKNAVVGDWAPFSILPKDSVEQHIVFEQRWDYPVVTKEIAFTLQQAHDGRTGWVDVGSWKLFEIDAEMFAQLAHGASYSTSPDGVPDYDDLQINPVDLHRLLKPAGSPPGPDSEVKESRVVRFLKILRDR